MAPGDEFLNQAPDSSIPAQKHRIEPQKGTKQVSWQKQEAHLLRNCPLVPGMQQHSQHHQQRKDNPTTRRQCQNICNDPMGSGRSQHVTIPNLRTFLPTYGRRPYRATPNLHPFPEQRRDEFQIIKAQRL